ncbi:HTTM domain-containing protein [Rhodohalobacter sp. 8-1]|uniref:HTTM domain-containing protein n=1 Tax=Rhodohalobacter sp. 8-1 TaxID=3131972 RepID=UPI0030EC48BA
MNTSSIREYFNSSTNAAPLAVFRIFFGALMLISIIRFAANGWIEKLYIDPTLSFSYSGFEWVQPLGGYTYIIFMICGLSAIFVSLGYKYKVAIITFFLSFTYIELMDKTTYLNHYYFISILSFLMIFLPAHAYFSVDAFRNEKLRSKLVPAWTIDSIKFLLCIVYFYAGLAKLNSDWLIHAMPLEIWLPSKYSLPILGDLFQQSWTHYAFSWAGALYDLTIPFLLLIKRTRVFAFALVVVFHILTRVLFPIGMFPYIMIVSALIFFDAGLHNKILSFISRILKISKATFDKAAVYSFPKPWIKNVSLSVIALFFVVQLLVPFRYMLYPGELFWTEEGYRFSWRVMLMEKTGYANFKVVDPATGQQFYVDNNEFLTRFQEKQMSFQPDFILEYAHFLEQHYKEQGIDNPEIYVDSYVALNGRGSQLYVNPEIDLTTIEQSNYRQTWLMPFEDEIKGL